MRTAPMVTARSYTRRSHSVPESCPNVAQAVGRSPGALVSGAPVACSGPHWRLGADAACCAEVVGAVSVHTAAVRPSMVRCMARTSSCVDIAATSKALDPDSFGRQLRRTSARRAADHLYPPARMPENDRLHFRCDTCRKVQGLVRRPLLPSCLCEHTKKKPEQRPAAELCGYGNDPAHEHTVDG